MNGDRTLNNRRLLEVIEYLDSKYIDEMFEDLKVPERADDTKITWKTPFKHWKQLVTLAACILLLSIASPLVSYIAEVISNFNAGAGSSSENSSELLTEPETTNGMYDEYILTEEDLAELNEAFFQFLIKDNPDYQNADESRLNEMRKVKNYASSIEEAMQRSTELSEKFYFGKYGDCIVVAIQAGSTMEPIPGYFNNEYKLGKKTFLYSQTMMFVCYNKCFYMPDAAYESGLLTDYDVEIMYQIYLEYYIGEIK